MKLIFDSILLNQIHIRKGQSMVHSILLDDFAFRTLKPQQYSSHRPIIALHH